LESAGDHAWRCWYPVGSDANREALERNLAAGVPVGVPAPGSRASAGDR